MAKEIVLFFLYVIVILASGKQIEERKSRLILEFDWPEPKKNLQRIPYIASCSHFYAIRPGGGQVLKKCPDGELFDYRTLRCRQKTEAKCWSDLFKRGNLKKKGNHFKCPFPWGLFPDTDDCSLFYDCLGGVPYTRKCPDNFLFDNAERNCIEAKEAMCADHKDVVEPDYKCPYKWGYFTHSKDCSKYYECLKKVPNIRTCKKNMLFDNFKRRCLPVDHVECGDRFNPYERPWVTKDISTSRPRGTAEHNSTRNEWGTNNHISTERLQETTNRYSTKHPWGTTDRFSTGRQWETTNRFSTGRPWETTNRFSTGQPWETTNRFSTERPWETTNRFFTGRPWETTNRYSTRRPWGTTNRFSTGRPWETTNRFSTGRPWETTNDISTRHPWETTNRYSTKRPWGTTNLFSTGRQWETSNEFSTRQPWETTNRFNTGRSWETTDQNPSGSELSSTSQTPSGSQRETVDRFSTEQPGLITDYFPTKSPIERPEK